MFAGTTDSVGSTKYVILLYYIHKCSRSTDCIEIPSGKARRARTIAPFTALIMKFFCFVFRQVKCWENTCTHIVGLLYMVYIHTNVGQVYSYPLVITLVHECVPCGNSGNYYYYIKLFLHQ